MAVSDEIMKEAERAVLMPVVMLINFSLFQYLLTLYHRRRGEPRIALLLVCAFLGFVAIIPQASSHEEVVDHLSDISDSCTTLTFLIQLIIIGRDIERKVRIASLKFVTWVAEALTAIGLFLVVLNLIRIFGPSVDVSRFQGIDNIVETASLCYVFFARFFYIAMSRGFKWVLSNKKFEMFLYGLFMTHEIPWYVLEAKTGISWEPVSAMWHRTTLTMCMLVTISEKMTKKNSGKSKLTVGASRVVTNEDNDSEGGSSKVHPVKSKPVGSSKRIGPETTVTRAAKLMRNGLASMRGTALVQSARVTSVTPGPSAPQG